MDEADYSQPGSSSLHHSSFITSPHFHARTFDRRGPDRPGGKELDRAGQHGRVLRLELSIGRLSGVNCDSIRFAFGLLAPGTVVDDAEIVIDEPKAVCHCRACDGRDGNRRPGGRSVPAATAGEITIEGGRELVLQSIEIEEQLITASLR